MGEKIEEKLRGKFSYNLKKILLFLRTKQEKNLQG